MAYRKMGSVLRMRRLLLFIAANVEDEGVRYVVALFVAPFLLLNSSKFENVRPARLEAGRDHGCYCPGEHVSIWRASWGVGV